MNDITLEMKNTINKVVENNADKYDFFGVRVQWEEFELGKISHKSLVWIDGEETEEELNGICVIDVNKIDVACDYFGEHIALIAGNIAECGNDIGELIIGDAEVLEILL